MTVKDTPGVVAPPPLIFLGFLIAGFAVRALLDSTLRDHILQEFMFFAGVLFAAASSNRVSKGNVNS